MKYISKLPIVLFILILGLSIHFNYRHLNDQYLSPLHPFMNEEERQEYEDWYWSDPNRGLPKPDYNYQD